MAIENLTSFIKEIDNSAKEQAKNRWDSVAKPLNSLGILEENIIKIAGIQGSKVDISKKAVVVMCGDNGVVEEGVTQTSMEVTAIVTENFAKGNTCVNIMSNLAGAKVFPVDVGIYRDLDQEGVIDRKIDYGTKNFTKEPAMTRDQAMKAINVGISMVKELVEQGYNLIATGEMGIGNTTTSSAVTAVILGMEVEKVTGRGSGLSSSGLDKKVNAIKKAIELHKPNRGDSVDILSKVGGYDLAGLTGVFIGGGLYGVPILVDGIISSAAALLAKNINSQLTQFMIASHISKEPAGEAIMKELGLKPFLNADMCLGEGTGAVAIMPLLDMAVSIYNNMSTFNQINVEDYTPQE